MSIENEIEFLKEKLKVDEIKKIGTGNSGEIYCGTIDDKNSWIRRVAIKTYQNDLENDKKRYFLTEVYRWMLKIRHEALVIPRRVVGFNDRLFVTMDFANFDFSTIILNKELSEDEILFYNLQICKSLLVLQELGVKYHQDLKPENLLCYSADNSFNSNTAPILNPDTGYIIKLADFGLTDVVFEDERKGRGGTFPFKAPEQYGRGIELDGYNPDVFAFGVILYLSINRKHPNGKSLGDVFEKKKSDKDGAWSNWAFDSEKKMDSLENKTLEKLIRNCVSVNPKERPLFKDIYKILNDELSKSGTGQRFKFVVESWFREYDRSFEFDLKNKLKRVQEIKNWNLNQDGYLDILNFFFEELKCILTASVQDEAFEVLLILAVNNFNELSSDQIDWVFNFVPNNISVVKNTNLSNNNFSDFEVWANLLSIYQKLAIMLSRDPYESGDSSLNFILLGLEEYNKIYTIKDLSTLEETFEHLTSLFKDEPAIHRRCLRQLEEVIRDLTFPLRDKILEDALRLGYNLK